MRTPCSQLGRPPGRDIKTNTRQHYVRDTSIIRAASAFLVWACSACSSAPTLPGEQTYLEEWDRYATQMKASGHERDLEGIVDDRLRLVKLALDMQDLKEAFRQAHRAIILQQENEGAILLFTEVCKKVPGRRGFVVSLARTVGTGWRQFDSGDLDGAADNFSAFFSPNYRNWLPFYYFENVRGKLMWHNWKIVAGYWLRKVEARRLPAEP